MLLGTLGAILKRNLLISKGAIRAGELELVNACTIRAGKDF